MRRARRPRSGAPLVIVALGGLLLTAGCQPAGGPSGAVNRTKLINQLAARLSDAEDHAYTAEYMRADGATATIAQDVKPLRTAYTWRGGALIVTPQGRWDCQDGPPTCVVTPSSPVAEGTNIAGLTDAAGHGILPPTTVMHLLTTAALASDVAIARRDATIAGEHATCLSVTPNTPAGEPFDACITDGGVLGSFTGDIAGERIDVRLTRYAESVEPGAFDPPAAARIVDERPHRS